MAKPASVPHEHATMTEGDNRRLATMVFVAWMVVITTSIWLGVTLFFGYTLTSAVVVLVGFGGIGGIGLSRLGFPTLAKSTLLALSNFGVFVGCFVIHPSSNLQYIYATFIGAPFLYFSLSRQTVYIIFFAGVAVLSGLLLTLIDIEALGFVEIGPEFSASVIAPLTWVTTVSFILAEFAFFVLQSERYQSSLHQANDTAQRASKAKSDFLANMSHEIRTPMNGVVGMIEILETTKLDSDQRQMTNTIRESSFALLRIVDDILDSSKIETGQISLETAPTNLRNEVTSVVQTVSETARKSNVRITTTVAPNTPHWVECDAGRLKQILLNVLGNAIKFSSRQDESGNVCLDVWPGKSGGIRILIRDDGVGMSADMKNKIFLPFTQSEEHSKRKYGGTGLGLSIVQKLVAIMNGKVWVRSAVGKGAAFLVSLPLESCAPPKTAKPQVSIDHAPQVNRSELKVLLVEDSVINQKVILTQLEKLGYSATVANNGRDGFDTWFKDSFDLILSDCHMPVMNGLEMTAEIRKVEENENRMRTPIIAITANALAGEAERCSAVGMDGYLSKPVRLTELTQAIKTVCP